MKRKVIKQKSAYTITLPIKWARDYGLDKRQEIDVSEEGDRLVISSNTRAKPNSISFELESSDEQYCRIMIENHYLKGYDKLNVSFKDKETILTIQNVVSNLVGIEIVKQDKNSCVISQTAMPTEDEFKSLFSRCLSILSYTLQICGESMQTDTYDELGEIEQLTRDARRFLLFLTRTIHKNTVVDRDDISFMHLLLERLILIQHNQMYTYQKLAKIEKRKIGLKVEKTFLKSSEMFSLFVKQLSKEDLKYFNTISREWEQIYFNHKLFVGCTEEESVVLFHSMYLAKQVFLIAQPNQMRQFRYVQ